MLYNIHKHIFYYLSSFIWNEATEENKEENNEIFFDSKINIVVATDTSLPDMLCVTITESEILKSYLPNCIVHYNYKIDYENYLNIINRLKRYNNTFWYENTLDDFLLLLLRYTDENTN